MTGSVRVILLKQIQSPATYESHEGRRRDKLNEVFFSVFGLFVRSTSDRFVGAF